MRYLRTVSTRRLLALIAGAVIAIAAGTAIAVASTSGGPVPPPMGLAQAIHKALAAPQVTGITADVSFTNKLIDSSDIVGVDPILTGSKGRLWASQDGFRLELQTQQAGCDAQVVVSGGSFWVYDPTANTVYQGKLPPDSTSGQTTKKPEVLPSVAEIQKTIADVMQGANVSGARPGDTGGQPTYTVRISPKHDGGLLGAAELAFDANHGVPLRLAVYASGNGNPVLELTAANVSYGPIDPSVYSVHPCAGAKVVNVSTSSLSGPAVAAGKAAKTRAAKLHAAHAGAAMTVGQVARKLKFKLVAPKALDGLPRNDVQLLNFGDGSGAVVMYGQGLGGIIVLERPASAGGSSTVTLPLSTPEGRRGVHLPSVSIAKGVSGQELDTALGTIVTFTRGGVSYTVLGSVPAVAADAAARAL
jgi:outer membrane lipoprotein-sorting protein